MQAQTPVNEYRGWYFVMAFSLFPLYMSYAYNIAYFTPGLLILFFAIYRRSQNKRSDRELIALDLQRQQIALLEKLIAQDKTAA